MSQFKILRLEGADKRIVLCFIVLLWDLIIRVQVMFSFILGLYILLKKAVWKNKAKMDLFLSILIPGRLK